MADNHFRKSGQNLTARAVMTLRDLIVNGGLQSDGRYTETQLAEMLSMSRTPIRAALQRMTDEGLLMVQPGGGYMIRQLTMKDIGEAIELRGLLEGHAARQLAEQGIAAGDLTDLANILAELDDLLDEEGFGSAHIPSYERLNARFHRILVESTGSALQIQEIGRANARPFASAIAFVGIFENGQFAQRHLMIGQDQHRAVIEAIRARQGARAEAIMREHARLSLRNLTRAMEHTRLLEQIDGAGLIRKSHEMAR